MGDAGLGGQVPLAKAKEGSMKPISKKDRMDKDRAATDDNATNQVN